MKTRLIDKLEIKDENVVKPIYFECLNDLGLISYFVQILNIYMIHNK